MIDWMDCSGRRGGAADYEVMVSVVQNRHNKDIIPGAADAYKNYALVITFRNRAFNVVERENAERVVINNITPNQTRMYFNFSTDKESGSGMFLSRHKSGDARSVRFSFRNRTMYDVVRGAWIGTYNLKYDRAEGYYYIEKENE